MKKKRLVSFFLILMLLTGLLIGCGADSSAPAPENAADSEAIQENKGLSGDTELENIPQSDRKLVKTVTIDAETQTYDTLVQELENQIADLGGYIESRDSHSGSSYDRKGSPRSASMKIRIPAESLPTFVAKVSQHANVLDTSEQTEDITLKYVDTESKITALETEQARLMELLSSAENLESILLIEERLNDVNYELESFNAQKRTFDNQVDYATVHLNLREVTQLTPAQEQSFWARISSGLVRNIQNLGRSITDFAVWLIISLPYLVLWAIVIGCVWFFVRRMRRKTKKSSIPRDPSE